MNRAVLMWALAWPSVASAGAWTRDQGHFYLGASYARLSATSFYGPDFKQVPIRPYAQQLLGFYGEVGILDRWLTATADGTLFRHNSLSEQGATYGVGDTRLGAWTGLLTRPVRLSLGITVGIPTGDSAPRAAPNADADAQLIARSLPTGNGQWDVESRVALGYAFGGARRWPLLHYVVVEAGYWLRTRFSDSFVWRAELGIKFPYPLVRRLWLIGKLNGVESFASNAAAAQTATGLGNGVTFIAPGVAVLANIVGGLGASIAVDSAIRARSLPAAAQWFFTLSYER